MSASPVHLTEAQILAYSVGRVDVPGSDVEGADLHLVGCNECWAAVQADRQGRLGAESLREVAPPEVRDRVGVAIRYAPTPARRLLRIPVWTVAAVVVGVLVSSSLFIALRTTGRPHDSPIVSAVVRAASTGSVTPAPSVSGASGQVAQLSSMRFSGVEVVVARSSRAFPMPYRAVPITSSGAPWLAMRGRVTLVCLDTPHPILLAAELPADVLMPLAHQLDPAS